MNKKFLSVILFSALMVGTAGTFTSCKDYDDDIENLQGQIDKLATKEDMSAQIATLQTALDAAKKDASDAIAKATAAETAAKAAGDDAAAAKAAADKAAAEAKTAAIEAAQAEVEAAKASLEKLVADGLAENKAEMDKLRNEISEATKKVEEIVGKIADMVTSVELVASYQSNPAGTDLTFSTAIEKDNVFSKDIANAITFTDGKQIQTGDKFVVRVSPTNAVLTPEMISLVNSKGEELDDFLKVEKVEKYDGLLTRAAANNGLWEVTVALNNYDKDAFKAVTENQDGKKILFAVEVNNTLSTAAARDVLSSYDLALGWTEYNPQNGLNFFVNEKNVANIHNRYSASENGTSTSYKELEWKGDVSTSYIGLDKPNTNVKQGDNRQNKPVYPAVQGETLTIALTTNDSKVEAPKNVRAMYVVLDSENAIESAPSEINAWNSYKYTGLNTVVEGTSTEITINGDNIIDDIIGFRVYAVNYDGTLVDPDGKAFYVKLGEAATTWEAVNTVVTPSTDDASYVDMTKSEAEAVTLSKLSAPVQATWTTDKIDALNDNPVFMAYFLDAQGNEIYNTYSMLNSALSSVDFSKITKVYTRPTGTDWKDYEDGKAYNGTLTIKNQDGFVLATLNVSMTKELPNSLPQGFSIKDKQVINGIYNCYMIADVWTAEQATKGTMPIENLINFGQGQPDQYNVEFASSAVVSGAKVDVTVNGDESIEVEKSFVDNATEHATKIVYNYGKVSSKKNSKGEYEDVVIEAATFNTVYCCFYKKDVHTWAWATKANLGLGDKNKLPYSTDLEYGKTVQAPTAAHIWGTNAIDKLFSTSLAKAYGSSLKIVSAKLTSDATGKEDYFKVDFSKANVFEAIMTEIGSNPKQDVPSTLTINCKDSYGHDVVITLKMTVKPRK